MKTILALAFLVGTFSSFANEIACSPVGDALSHVTITKTATSEDFTTLKITVYDLDDSKESYQATVLNDSFNKIGKESVSVIGKSEASIEFGGGVSDASLLTFSKDAKKAVFAAKSTVYIMNCLKEVTREERNDSNRFRAL